MLHRQRAESLELCVEERLVDLPVIDRNMLFDADPDHFLAFDPDLFGELIWRQMVGQLGSLSFGFLACR